MAKKGLPRREALVRMVEYVGAAAGLSAAGVKSLVAQVQKITPTRNLDRLLTVQPIDRVAKFIKIMVFPREDVFQSLYGRRGILEWRDIGEGHCMGFVGVGDFTTSLKECDDNKCGEQDCPELMCSGTNECGTQNCGKQQMPANNDWFSTASIERIRTDPFIQGLFRELQVTTSAALSTQLKSMVRQPRR